MTINLSDVAVPDAITVPDTDKIFSAWLARLRDIYPDFTALVESDPAFKIGEVNAYQTALLLARSNDQVRAVMLASAAGADLDNLGVNFDVPRIEIAPGAPDAVPLIAPTMESDDNYRNRIQASWGRLSTAGAELAYRFFAASADPDVADARAYGPDDHERPGEVHLYVLSRNENGIPAPVVLDAVYAAVNADEVRPLTDFVSVYPAVIVEFSVIADIHVPYGPDNDVVMDTARDALDAYLMLTRKIGVRVSRSGIFSVLHQTGVITVRMPEPVDDVVVGVGEVGLCTNILLTKVVDDVGF